MASKARIFSDLVCYLTLLDKAARMNRGDRGPFASGYYSPAGLVLGLGRRMHASRRPPPRTGSMKMCFANAQTLALDDDSLEYAEGWATHYDVPIPVLHGWCLNRRGCVVDPTWHQDCSNRSAYFGVRIAKGYVQQRIHATLSYGSLLDDWNMGFALLNSDVRYSFARISPG